MKTYRTPEALLRALEDRLIAFSRRGGGDLQRMRRQVAFDRLLCRLFAESDSPWLLKGGYSLPREGRPNSRVKDLVDLVLLVESGTLDRNRVGQCVEATFRRRDTHRVPSSLEPPPQTWAGPFADLASKCGLSHDLAAAFSRIAEFFSNLHQ